MSVFRFGWLEECLTFKGDNFEINPVPDFTERISAVLKERIVTKNWIYPPIYGKGDSEIVNDWVRFELPSTHELIVSPEFVFGGREAEFYIAALGFILGVQLVPDGYGYMNRFCRKSYHLVGFTPVGRDLERSMNTIMSFYKDNLYNKEALDAAYAVIYWYIASQSYHQPFEVFNAHYSILDALHRASKLTYKNYMETVVSKKNFTHKEIPALLSEFYNIKLPEVFCGEVNSGRKIADKLSQVRNQLIHEARWLGKPLGHKMDAGSWELLKFLIFFNSQVILGFLGINCLFRRAVDWGQLHGLDVIVP